jgi:hypothetical protein
VLEGLLAPIAPVVVAKSAREAFDVLRTAAER